MATEDQALSFPLERLPIELLFEASGYLPSEDLKNLSLANSRMRGCLIPVLYRFVRLNKYMKKRLRAEVVQKYGKYVRCISITCKEFEHDFNTPVFRELQLAFLGRSLPNCFRMIFTTDIEDDHFFFCKPKLARRWAKLLNRAWHTIASNPNLRSLRTIGSQVFSHIRYHEGIMATIFSRLENLEIVQGSSIDINLVLAKLRWRDNRSNFLVEFQNAQKKNLKRLSLELGDDPPFYIKKEPPLFSRLLLLLDLGPMPNVRVLRLRRAIITDQLANMLANNFPNLEELELDICVSGTLNFHSTYDIDPIHHAEECRNLIWAEFWFFLRVNMKKLRELRITRLDLEEEWKFTIRHKWFFSRSIVAWPYIVGDCVDLHDVRRLISRSEDFRQYLLLQAEMLYTRTGEFIDLLKR